MKTELLGVSKHFLAVSAGILVSISMLVVPARGQLQVTEFMYDTLASGDSVMEWVEVRNLGGSAVDLNGAFMDSLGDTVPPPGATANIRNDLLPGGVNTIVPAGGVAVIYDAFLSSGSPFNYDTEQFRTSWNMPMSSSIIPADFWPGLNNSGADSIGIWTSRTEYDMDAIPDPMGGFDTVGSFDHTLVNANYSTASPWPGAAQGHSIQWTGNGSNQDGANWYESTDGVNGATTNAAINLQGANLNSTSDIGSPGFVSAGTAPNGLSVTEIMYNPRSTEPGWEWVEVYNKTGAAIDFSSTPYVLDDISGANLTAENITSGLIPDGSVAVLFDADSLGLTVQNMKDAWGNTINFIPVNGFPALNNTGPSSTDGGGDTFGIWNSLADYSTDSAGATREFTNAAVSIDYDISSSSFPNDWPDDDGNASIYLTNLGNDPTMGSSWLLSALGDGLSYNPNQVSGVIVVHPGGDVGSPGTFTALAAGIAGDYNDDGTVDAADYVIWRKTEGTTATLPNDPTGGTIGTDQYNTWRAHFGQSVPGSGSAINAGAVPEPTGLALVLLALIGFCPLRHRA